MIKIINTDIKSESNIQYLINKQHYHIFTSCIDSILKIIISLAVLWVYSMLPDTFVYDFELVKCLWDCGFIILSVAVVLIVTHNIIKLAKKLAKRLEIIRAIKNTEYATVYSESIAGADKDTLSLIYLIEQTPNKILSLKLNIKSNTFFCEYESILHYVYNIEVKFSSCLKTDIKDIVINLKDGTIYYPYDKSYIAKYGTDDVIDITEQVKLGK